MGCFCLENETVIDQRTGLMWTRNASLLDFPMRWEEALQAVTAFNVSELFGYNNWRVPNRKELFSLLCHDTMNPSLPAAHPFMNVFNGYYWTSSTCARLPNQAWYIHLGGARVFKGMKYGSYMVWPVRTDGKYDTQILFKTGQTKCFNEGGIQIDCRNTGQDGEIQAGLAGPRDRFVEADQTIIDNHTGLTWLRDANVFEHMMDWRSAFDRISRMNSDAMHGHSDWRVPNIIEMESLTDIGRHSPALPEGHPFNHVQDFYWSSSTSRYDLNYAWVLYMIDGAVGVGYKPLSEFHLWPVRGTERLVVH